MGGLNAETAGNLLSGGQDIYNMVEDNKKDQEKYGKAGVFCVRDVK